MANRKDYSRSYPGYRTKIQGWNSPYVELIPNREVASRTSSGERRPKPRGRWIAPTAYSMTEDYRREANGYEYGLPRNAYSMQYFGELDHHPSVADLAFYTQAYGLFTLPSDLAGKAILKARLALKDQRVNLGQAWAEKRQVSGQILKTVETLTSAAWFLRRGQWKSACKALGIDGVKPAGKTLASQWLGYQYGWKPLLSDIHGAVTTLAELDRDQWMVTVKGSASSKDRSDRTYGPNGFDHFRGNCEGFHGAMCRIDAVPGNAAVASAASLGLLNPALLAWELVPFSFVVDWFVPIGNYLSQFDALAGWEIRGYSLSTISRFTGRWVGLSQQWNPDYYITRSWEASWRRVVLNRSVGTSVPFTFMPHVKDPVSASHVANAAALLRAAFR